MLAWGILWITGLYAGAYLPIGGLKGSLTGQGFEFVDGAILLRREPRLHGPCCESKRRLTKHALDPLLDAPDARVGWQA